MYADFECVTKPISSCSPIPETSFNEAYQHHEPLAFSYYITYTEGFYKPPVVYRGPDAAKVFVSYLKAEAREIEKIYTTPKTAVPLTQEESDLFDSAV